MAGHHPARAVASTRRQPFVSRLSRGIGTLFPEERDPGRDRQFVLHVWRH